MSTCTRLVARIVRGAPRIQLQVVAILLATAAHAQDVPAWEDFDPSALNVAPVPEDAPRAITSRDLLGGRDITGARISPDGKSVACVVSQAVLESNAYRTALFVAGTEPGSVPLNLGSVGAPHWTSVGEYARVSPQWSPDNRHIAYLVRTGDRRQIYLWRRSGGEPKRLTSNVHDVESYDWLPDRRHDVFTTVEQLDPREIRRTAEQGILYDNNATGLDNAIKASQARTIAHAIVAARPREKRLWVFDLATRAQRKATDAEAATYAESHLSLKPFEPGDKIFLQSNSMKRSPDGSRFAYRGQLIDVEKLPHYGWTIFIRRAHDKDPVEVMPPTKETVIDLWWSGDGNEIYFLRTTNEGGTALYAVPASGGLQRAITRVDDLLLQVSFDDAMSRLAGVRENALSPPELVVIDVESGTQHTVASVNPEFRNISLSAPTRLEWSNKYGDKTFGFLVKPLVYEAGKRYPLIVTTYRAYGFLRGAVGDEYPIQLFAASGFAVLVFDEGNNEPIPRPGDFRTGMMRWYSPFASLETAVELLDQMGIVDPQHKGLTGLSFGAEITNFTISHSDLFQAAAASATNSVDPSGTT